jgi:hypothetical protein
MERLKFSSSLKRNLEINNNAWWWHRSLFFEGSRAVG